MPKALTEYERQLLALRQKEVDLLERDVKLREKQAWDRDIDSRRLEYLLHGKALDGYGTMPPKWWCDEVKLLKTRLGVT